MVSATNEQKSKRRRVAQHRHRRRRRRRARAGHAPGRHAGQAQARRSITLVDRSRTHLWKPLLHQVAAGSMDLNDHELDYLYQARWHHFQFRLGRMDGLDRARKEIHLAPTVGRGTAAKSFPRCRIAYDTLVLAVGSTTNDFGTPGAARARDLAGQSAAGGAVSLAPAQCLPARECARGAAATGPAAHRHHRCRRHRRGTCRGTAQHHPRVRVLRPGPHRSRARHQDHHRRGRAQDPAGAARALVERGARAAEKTQRRGADRRARDRSVRCAG